MKILLLQSSVYLPSFGGGNKSNRLLLEALAERGYECWAVSKSLDSQTVIDRTSELNALSQRGIACRSFDPSANSYQYRKVNVITVDTNREPDFANTLVAKLYRQIWPDVLLVSDDKDGHLLAAALRMTVKRSVLLLHTNLHLPFGEEATDQCTDRLEHYKRCKYILCATEYTQSYVLKESGLQSVYIPFPVYGSGPFTNIANFSNQTVGMINPCSVKGLDVFIGLANQFPDLSFICVPTWGANDTDIRTLEETQNVTIIPPRDNVGEVLKHMSVLLVPSLIPETFGYVSVEAMLRGIPVLASDLGGLRQAKLGVDYLLPVKPAINSNGVHIIPTQDLEPWALALEELTGSAERYRRCSIQSFDAANEYVSGINIDAFDQYFRGIAAH